MVTDSEFPQFPSDTGFYRTLRQRVAKYFETTGLDSKSPWAGLWRMALVFAVAAFTFAVMNGTAWVFVCFALALPCRSAGRVRAAVCVFPGLLVIVTRV